MIDRTARFGAVLLALGAMLTCTAFAPIADHAQRRFPGDLLDLSNWSLTLPTGRPDDPTEVAQPELDSYRDQHFHLDSRREGVVFSAPAGGVTTPNSNYPRSELREMDGARKAAWSNSDGTHALRVRAAVTAVPPVKPEVVAAQIHDGDDDILQVRLNGTVLAADFAGEEPTVLDPQYSPGRIFTVDVVAADGQVAVYHDGVRRAVAEVSGTTWYFKTGSYVQSNPERGEAPDAVGEVVLYEVRLDHF